MLLSLCNHYQFYLLTHLKIRVSNVKITSSDPTFIPKGTEKAISSKYLFTAPLNSSNGRPDCLCSAAVGPLHSCLVARN